MNKFTFLMILTFVGFGIAYPLTIWVDTIEEMTITFFTGNAILLTGLILYQVLYTKEREKKKNIFTNPPYSNGDRWYKP